MGSLELHDPSEVKSEKSPALPRRTMRRCPEPKFVVERRWTPGARRANAEMKSRFVHSGVARVCQRSGHKAHAGVLGLRACLIHACVKWGEGGGCSFVRAFSGNDIRNRERQATRQVTPLQLSPSLIHSIRPRYVEFGRFYQDCLRRHSRWCANHRHGLPFQHKSSRFLQ
ncbi:hypothetical protein HETIRDRAFT_440276 [Heterobasidion irregulare TC 32-1]|uniref:Uncharacterized protein n=1 Tax=Heterobasidion irregulare (strain TC 32-1) TaxID=747525 RepID=W4K377_HETIT|nr:uncharacterized protein HETIRDRAFT_440276 [Heterobasidion irregulare TC 32-1]ETW80268.1 hypothetical protein HETIRDRAFT_440276 [Heterobasidion irregulare TC 32-1]